MLKIENSYFEFENGNNFLLLLTNAISSVQNIMTAVSEAITTCLSLFFCRLVTENCYPWEGGRMTECYIPKKKKEKTAPCPRLQDNNCRGRTPLHRVGPVYRIATEKGIMQEIITSGPVQGACTIYTLNELRASSSARKTPSQKM